MLADSVPFKVVIPINSDYVRTKASVWAYVSAIQTNAKSETKVAVIFGAFHVCRRSDKKAHDGGLPGDTTSHRLQF